MKREDMKGGMRVVVTPVRAGEAPFSGAVAESGHMGELVQVVPDDGACTWVRPEHCEPEG